MRIPARQALAILLLGAVLLTGCAASRPSVTVERQVRTASHEGTARAERPARVQTGVASYYGGEHTGARTASGERFDPKSMTAAHRTLPFGTRVRVTNLANGRSVVVRVNDRGPFRKSRIVDVSRAAAAELRMIASGTAKVRLEVIGEVASGD